MSTTTQVTEAEIAHFLTEQIAKQLKVPREKVLANRPLAELGLDSVYALTLCADLEDWLHIEVEPTMAWDHPTIEKMSRHLITLVKP